ncbi:MAG: TRAP transporter large permease [Clostridiales bacterium]|nr:TRAP transporter large permease [Clostridiales bacterium]
MIAVAVFIIALAIGIPIAWMLGMCGMSYIFSIDPALLQVIPQKMMSGAANYSLLCIPLFILAGELMALSGDVDRLWKFARCIVGHIKGGLCYVTVLVGTMLGASLGSAIAEAALLGGTVYPKLREDGYDEDFSSSLIAAVSVIGPIIPPGMTFVIYGVVANVSIQKLFVAGIMPGIYMALALSSAIFLLGLRRDWKCNRRAKMRETLVALKEASFSILVPAAALFALASGIATPTESASVLSTLILAVGMFVYRQIKVKDLIPLFSKAAVTAISILLISNMANIFGYALAYDQIPQKIAGFVVSVSSNKYVILLMINLLFLFVGMIMEPMPAIYILVPVLLPIIRQFGFDPIHIGLVICVNMATGLITPPVGSALYTAAMATNVSADRMVRSIWPWVGVLVVVLFFVTYVPSSFMWLVNLLN